MLDNTSSQASKFRTRNRVEINDDSHGNYNTNSQIRFKTSIQKSGLCDYNVAYILVEGTILVANTAATGAAANKNDIEVIFKHCTPFTDCLSEIDITLIYNAKKINIVMPMYNLTQYSYNYSKTSGSLWQYRDEPALNDNDGIVNFRGNSACLNLDKK